MDVYCAVIVTSELGDRQSSHPVKTLLQHYGKSLEALPGVAYPGFRDNRSTLNTKTGFLKNCHCGKAVARDHMVHRMNLEQAKQNGRRPSQPSNPVGYYSLYRPSPFMNIFIHHEW